MALAALPNPRQHQTRRETTFKAAFPFLGTGSAELFLHSPRVSLPLREMLFLRRALEPQRTSESCHIYRIGRDGEEP